MGKSHPENGTLPVGKAATPAVPEKSTPLSISRVGAHALCQSGSQSAPVGSAVASEPLRETMAGLLVSHRATATAATAKRRPSMG